MHEDFHPRKDILDYISKEKKEEENSPARFIKTKIRIRC